MDEGHANNHSKSDSLNDSKSGTYKMIIDSYKHRYDSIDVYGLIGLYLLVVKVNRLLIIGLQSGQKRSSNHILVGARFK